jgi:hypothetical protein
MINGIYSDSIYILKVHDICLRQNEGSLLPSTAMLDFQEPSVERVRVDCIHKRIAELYTDENVRFSCADCGL